MNTTNRFLKTMLLGLALTMAWTSTALAGPQGQGMKAQGRQAVVTERFNRADTNGDGQLNQQEWQQMHQQRHEKMRQMADADGDGRISDTERQAIREQRQQMREQRLQMRNQ